MSRFFKDIKKFFNYTVFSSKAELKSEVAIFPNINGVSITLYF